jgi:hypothetical protein
MVMMPNADADKYKRSKKCGSTQIMFFMVRLLGPHRALRQAEASKDLCLAHADALFRARK